MIQSYWEFMRPTYAQDKGDIQADMYSSSYMYMMIVIGRHAKYLLSYYSWLYMYFMIV